MMSIPRRISIAAWAYSAGAFGAPWSCPARHWRHGPRPTTPAHGASSSALFFLSSPQAASAVPFGALAVPTGLLDVESANVAALKEVFLDQISEERE